MTPRAYVERMRRSAEDGECEHDTFMCSSCFYKMAERVLTEATKESTDRAERLTTALRAAIEFAEDCHAQMQSEYFRDRYAPWLANVKTQADAALADASPAVSVEPVGEHRGDE